MHKKPILEGCIHPAGCESRGSQCRFAWDCRIPVGRVSAAALSDGIASRRNIESTSRLKRKEPFIRLFSRRRLPLPLFQRFTQVVDAAGEEIFLAVEMGV